MVSILGDIVADYDRRTIFWLVTFGFFFIPIPIGPKEPVFETAFRNFVDIFNTSVPDGLVEGYMRTFRISNDSIEMQEEYFSDDAVNRFSSNSFHDLTNENFTSPIDMMDAHHQILKRLRIQSTTYPIKIDWREQGSITEVRQQGECGSCYVHSVIGSIESAVAINRTAPSVEMSIQQLVDCGKNFNMGCAGGDTCDLLAWLKRDKVQIVPMKYYPTLGKMDKSRMKNVLSNLPHDVPKVQVIGYTCSNFTGFEHEMLNILAHQGPLVAAVHGLGWRNYNGGVISRHCDGPLNHAVQIVGYDLSASEPHYIVRNSWGRKFGINGYAKVAIGKNMCQIASRVSTVNVELR